MLSMLLQVCVSTKALAVRAMSGDASSSSSCQAATEALESDTSGWASFIV